MLISSTEVDNRLENPENIIRRREDNLAVRKLTRVKLPEHESDSTAIVPLNNGGRRPGDRNLTPESRATIGAEASLLTLDEVAKQHNVSRHHVQELSQGMHSNAQGVNIELVDNINKKLQEPHEIALQKLTAALLAIDEAKLTKEKPKDLAMIARSLSGVAEHTAPIKHTDPEDDILKKCQLIVYSPTIKNENHYQTVAIATPVKVND